jgi:hypothetical protein
MPLPLRFNAVFYTPEVKFAPLLRWDCAKVQPLNFTLGLEIRLGDSIARAI